MRDSAHPPVRSYGDFLRWVALGFAGVLLVAALTAAWLLRGVEAYADAHRDRILPGVTIAGVDVAGMTHDEALEAVHAELAGALDRELTVTWEGESWTTTPRELGSSSDAEGAVAQALEASGDVPWTTLAMMRYGERELPLAEDVALTHDPREVVAFVSAIAEGIDAEPRDAAIDASTGWVELVPHEVGYRTDVTTSAERLLAALERGEEEAPLEVTVLRPEVTTDAFSQVILVRQREHRVYLYEHGEIVGDWPVAVGTAGYATPTGVHHVTLKRHMPTWVNPAPNGWGAHMPARIGPGRHNPLGVRAINWSVGAIRFHGTENLRSIGTDASKGCVRFTNDDVVEFYDLVREGAAIVSIRA